MNKTLSALLVGFVFFGAPLFFSMEPWAPNPSPKDLERVQGFAEFEGIPCRWVYPTIWQYLWAGRPVLSPHALCSLRLETSGTPIEQAQSIRRSIEASAQRSFSNQKIVVGFTSRAIDSPLTCYFPGRDVTWARCEGLPQRGCFLNACRYGLAP